MFFHQPSNPVQVTGFAGLPKI